MTGLALYVDIRAGAETDTQSDRVTPLAADGEWIRDAFQTVERLSALPPGWDGHQSPRITDEAQESALRVLDFIATWPIAPHIAAVPSGGLQFEWSLRDRGLEIEILPDGSAVFLAVMPDESETEKPIAVSHTAIRALLTSFFVAR